MMNAMFRTVVANGEDELRLIEDMRRRAGEANEAITRQTQAILDDVKRNGFTAVCEYSIKFDRTAPYEITKEQLDKAYNSCDKALIDALLAAEKNIRSYHERMLCKSWDFERAKGARVGQIVAPLQKVGIYVPGGTAAYPSSVLMNAIPAKVAGVKEIIMVTPPGKNLNNAVLAAAKIAGIDHVIAVGGVQAIAALTYSCGLYSGGRQDHGAGKRLRRGRKTPCFRHGRHRHDRGAFGSTCYR